MTNRKRGAMVVMVVVSVLVLGLSMLWAQVSGPAPAVGTVAPVGASRASSTLKSRFPAVVDRELSPRVGEGGAAISTNGEFLVFADADASSLHIVNLDTKQESTLVPNTEGGLGVFSNPSFTEDTSRIVFGARGETWYYGSAIYSMKIDGSDLTEIRAARRFSRGEKTWVGGPYFAEEIGQPEMSPDGAAICFRVHDVLADRDEIALIKADGSAERVLVEGLPVAWTADGNGVYYVFGGGMKRFDISDGSSETVPMPGRVFGRLPDRDVFLTQDGTSLVPRNDHGEIVDIGVKLSIPTVVGPALAPNAEELRRLDQEVKNGQSAGYTFNLQLEKVQWSAAGRILVVYGNEVSQRIEVLRLAN